MEQAPLKLQPRSGGICKPGTEVPVEVEQMCESGRDDTRAHGYSLGHIFLGLDGVARSRALSKPSVRQPLDFSCARDPTRTGEGLAWPLCCVFDECVWVVLSRGQQDPVD